MTGSGSSEPSPASAASPSAASAAGAAGAAPSSELLGFFFAGAAFFAAPSFDGRFLPFLGSSPVVILTAPLTRSWSTVPASLAALPSTLLRTLPNSVRAAIQPSKESWSVLMATPSAPTSTIS